MSLGMMETNPARRCCLFVLLADVRTCGVDSSVVPMVWLLDLRLCKSSEAGGWVTYTHHSFTHALPRRLRP